MNKHRLELDYIAKARRSRGVGLLVLLVALGIAADLGWRFRSATLELRRAGATQDLLLQAERAPAKALSPELQDAQARTAELVAQQLALPWAALIDVLENTVSKDVAILQMQPEAQQRVIRITAEARNQDSMLQYLRAISENRMLNDVHLLGHRTQTDDPQRPLQFSVQATFKVAK